MSSIVDSLPDRPLLDAEVEAIEDPTTGRISLVREETADGVVHFYVQTPETLYSLVYDDAAGEWRLDDAFEVESAEWERHTAEWFDETTDEEFDDW
ncbi:hypothetical protein [Candidatus Halobonum tyrrellensis]|uniref:hypothetical protein n=1 Tax=Candidatus Halobonum tyrrellensis TaxID=1431545 RepID=UPI000677C735|nr:hypothetical protein [Candidatus Halobonum tyrrellensis]